jgi:hypothetical protein
MMEAAPSLRDDLPFRRIAVVLAGGGALGAYEAGVLRELSRLGVRPAILAGTSAGAINAVVWRAHDFDSRVLERTWAEIRPSTVGMRWTTLTLRAGGMLLAGFAGIQVLLALLGSPELGTLGHVWLKWASGRFVESAALDALAWVLVMGLGTAMVLLSRPAEEWLAALQRPGRPSLETRWLGRALLAGVAIHLVVWLLGAPWPHRFSATVLAVGGILWVINRPGRAGDLFRRLLARLLPETRGRGLWGDAARHRLMRRLVREGDPERLTSPGTLLLLTGLALDSGRIAYFVAGDEPGPSFASGIADALGEVVRLRTPRAVIEAAVASSAIPLAFEPVRIGRREFIDAGQFSNQPLEAALAAGADAMLVVLVAPRGGPRPAPRGGTLVDLGARLLEIASWRELQLQLRALPAAWASEHPLGAARLCVVAPHAPLSAGVLSLSPEVAIDLMGLGEADARQALGLAGWVRSEAGSGGE